MWRSLVAHLAWDEGVARSNRVIPTIYNKDFQQFTESHCFLSLCKYYAIEILYVYYRLFDYSSSEVLVIFMFITFTLVDYFYNAVISSIF